MSQGQKIGALAGVVVLALALAAWGLLRGDGDPNANVAEFARSIDNTKGDTPSVPPDRLSLGRTGPRKSGP